MATYGQAIYGQAVYGAVATAEKKRMSKFKRDPKGLPVTDKVALGKQAITNYGASTVVGDVTTELADFTAANGDLDAKNTAANTKRQEAVQATTELENSSAVWDAKLEKLMSKTEDNTDNDKAKMETTGFATYEPGKATAVGTPAKVENLTASTGDNPGDADLQWNALKPRARMFEVRYIPGLTLDETKMQSGGTTTASRITIPGLVSGADHLFQVRAHGSSGLKGPWSDPARGRAG